MIKRKLLVVLVFLCFICFFSIGEDGLKDDYYLSINKSVLESKILEDDEYSWSYFLDAQDRVDNDVDNLVKDIISGNNSYFSDREVSSISGVYESAVNMGKRNSNGTCDLDIYLDRVWESRNIDELVKNIGFIENSLGIDIITNIEIMQDYNDNSKNIVYFTPVTYAFGASGDYMVNDDYMAYKAYIRRACVRLWKLYNYKGKNAREVVERVFSFYEEIANSSKSSIELDEIVEYYNIVSEDDINNLFSNVNNAYFKRKGISNQEYYSLVDMEQYKALMNSLINDNLEVWKEVIVTKILSSYASYLDSGYVEVVNSLSNDLMGNREELSDDDMAIDIVKGLFSGDISNLYSNSYLNDEEVSKIEKMFLDIKSSFKDRLNSNKWLSKEALKEALLKLDEMDIVIGSDNNSYNLALELDGISDSLVNNVIKISEFNREFNLERLNSGVKYTFIDQSTVNAYYQPLENKVVVPVAFLELVGKYDSYYEMLGTVGMILAHEVVHAFDGNGSLFDSSGNMRDWWSIEDKNTFMELKSKVSDFYSKYEVIDGKYINGDKTVNENIADMGAMECIVDIARKNDASDKEFKIMFSSFANIWSSVEKDEYMRLLLLQDVHAPNRYRVNAALSNIEEFYQVYNIYPWDDMWISNDDRVLVW